MMISRRQLNERSAGVRARATTVHLTMMAVAIVLLAAYLVDASTVAVPPLLTTTNHRQQHETAFSIVLSSSSSSSPSSSSSAVSTEYDFDDDDDDDDVLDASSTTATAPTTSSSEEEESSTSPLPLSLSPPPSSQTTIAAADGSGGNVVVQIAVSMKDEMVRYMTGIKELYTNHQRCNQIRIKQKDYREKLRKQWEFEESDLTAKDLKSRLAKVNGGITYDEYLFLVKGKVRTYMTGTRTRRDKTRGQMIDSLLLDVSCRLLSVAFHRLLCRMIEANYLIVSSLCGVHRKWYRTPCCFIKGSYHHRYRNQILPRKKAN
jgi:hypothetical protein